MRRGTISMMAALALLLGLGEPMAAGASPPRQDPVFVDGGPMAGSSNGLSFGPDGSLYVANVFGATITRIDPDSGEIIERLTAADSVFFPDDVVVAADGTIYWTEIALGTVFKRPPGGPSFPLLPIPFGLNSANPLTLSDDGSRLFAAGCYGAPPANNSLVEIDPVNGGIVNTLRSDVAGCASNGMAWHDGALYSPQPFGDSVLRIDPDTGDSTVVTSGYATPVGVAFDSTGDLFAVSQGSGELVRIDLHDPDTAGNREVISTFPYGWVDNLAFDADDRLFVSSASDGTIVEVLGDGSQRIVVEGQFQIPMGVAVMGRTVYTTHPQAIVGFDRRTGERTSIIRSAFGVGPLPASTNVVTWGRRLVLMSALSGEFAVWDPKSNTAIHQTLMAAPGDAQPFQGDLIVTETGTGDIVRLSGDDLNERTVIAAGLPAATGLAARGDDLYVADAAAGTILQLISDGVTLSTPVVVVSGLAIPEGIDVRGNRMYVVEAGTQSLIQIDLRSGERQTVAADLGLIEPLPGITAFGFFNNVTVAGTDIYVNADRANVIYRFAANRNWR